MLLMVEERIRGGICHSIHRHAKANNKYWKIMMKIKNLPIFNIETPIIYVVGQCIKNYQ